MSPTERSSERSLTEPGSASKLGRRWTRLETVVTGFLMGGALALVLYTVLLRYFAPVYAPTFTEEVTVYAVMWSVLLACGHVTRSREHVRADLVIHLLPERVQRGSDIAANLAGVVFAAFLALYGGRVAYAAWFYGDLSPTLLRFPLWIYYGALPVAAVLIGIGHLRVAVDLLRGVRPMPEQPSPVE